MADEFFITPYKVRSAGTDVPPEEVQAAINSLAQQVTVDLNILSTQSETPTGPAGGDLSGTYPNPTVVSTHLTAPLPIAQGGTGQATQTAALTAILGSSVIPVANGGTGSATTPGGLTNLGAGTIATQNANSVAITGGTIDNAPIGQTTKAAGAFTTLTSTGGAINGTVGATTANTGAFTTLAASSTVSGAGFSTYLASPPAIGTTTAAAGAFTTLSSTGNFTPSQTNGIVGTTTTNNANVGSVGEYVSATVSSATSINVTTATNLTSLSLTAGDWDVTGNAAYTAGTSTITQVLTGINTVSATSPGLPAGAQNACNVLTGAVYTQIAPTTRISISATTTVYLVGYVGAASGTATYQAIVRARRVR